LKVRRAALVLWQQGTNMPESMTVYERPEESDDDGPDAFEHLLVGKNSRRNRTNGAITDQLATERTNKMEVLELFPPSAARRDSDPCATTPCAMEVPITYRNSVIGGLLIEDDTPFRNWEDEEILMVKTVSDQLSVAISHARLFRQMETQAMTDALTGLFNHRSFQDRLDREAKLADRNNEQVSLILLDLDHLKRINDTYGHRSGDGALCHVATIMKSTVRDVDICARYGGEEFVVILPQCGRENAIDVAERLREAIASNPVPKVGQVTASIGVATYPSGAKNKEELVEMADRAMYLAKAAGRNRVRTLAHRSYSGLDVR
jgi:diguanylate cyclase (GGDEF)-like protein